MTEKLGILAIGHGSKLPYNKEVVTQMQIISEVFDA
jgi:sirohydrochlorin cobaltochelatase